MNTQKLRREYAAKDPFEQFEKWFADAVAAELDLPDAMTLATAEGIIFLTWRKR